MSAFIQEPCDESIIRSRTATAPCAKSSGPWVLAATTLASSMAFIDGTVVNVALPALQTNLNATIVDVQWVIEAYSLLLSALLLVGGSLGDHYGRRRVFLIGVAVRCGVYVVRPRSRHTSTDCRTCSTGTRRGSARSRQSRNH